ncbi:proton channel OTOP1-like [Spea bombifrons]|uniref:proton channel OTOP1-like n=1 Tax=Spea bombifrons TaxID=233779 RepID=UPI00234B91FF|nr:proton channel OTOP1-like [Spea bombifrons]
MARDSTFTTPHYIANVVIDNNSNKIMEAIIDNNSTVIMDTDNNLHEDVDGTKNNALVETIFPQSLTENHKHKAALYLPGRNTGISSSQYGINIFIIGILLLFACSLHITDLSECYQLTFLIILVSIQILWMLWYICISDRKRRSTKEKDSHAGARWLRCGIVLFAITTVVMDFLKLGYFIGYSKCMPVVEGIYPATHIVHTVFQVYFLWYHSKDIIQSFKTLERFGLIHSVFTNLLLWATAVATESKHQLQEHMERLTSLGFTNISIDEDHPQCNCTTELCDVFSRGIYYIYPFNIEYHILASAMFFVLWKNIGNNTTYQKHKNNFRLKDVAVGAACGLAVLVVTIVVVVLYLFNIGHTKSKSESALSIYYWYSIAVLSAMCIASLVGLTIHRLERKPIVLGNSPAIKLDGNLLMGSACGSWITSWGSILAIIYAESRPTYTWYNLPYSILVIIEKYIQNIFIVSCIYCMKEKTSTDSNNGEIPVMPLQIASFAYHANLGTCNKGDMEVKDSSKDIEVIKEEQEGRSPSHVSNRKQWNIKKLLLKNITVALFLSNISLWIPPAFGCRPQYDNGLEAIVFGFVPWIIVIDIALPFSIFYRMHSAYSLFDVYCKI